MSKKADLTIRLLMIGDSSVGKTSILTKYVTDEFNPQFQTTIGVDFQIKHIKANNKTIKLQLWDTAGQEKFKAVITSYFRNTHGALVVYDVTNKESFINIKKWIEDINKYCSKDVNIFLIANKIDIERWRVITTEEGRALAKKYNILYFECSAKSGQNIENIYNNVATIISKTMVINEMVNKTNTIVLGAEIKKERKWYC
jgi:small GTP-binding protein